MFADNESCREGKSAEKVFFEEKTRSDFRFMVGSFSSSIPNMCVVMFSWQIEKSLRFPLGVDNFSPASQNNVSVMNTGCICAETFSPLS